MKVINEVSYARVYCFLVETELISSEARTTVSNPQLLFLRR